MSEPKEKTQHSATHTAGTIIGIILCVILLPILIVNIFLIIRSFTDKDSVPSIGGYLPLIVQTDSMNPDIKSGDLIVCRTVEPDRILVGDYIAFFDPEGNGTSVVTHKVIEILGEGDSLSFRTQGIANNIADRLPVAADKVVGRYRFRVPYLGNIAMFMQTTPGFILCVAVPIFALLGYDMLRRRKYDRQKQQDTDALLAELNELRAKNTAKEAETNEKATDTKEKTDQTR